MIISALLEFVTSVISEDFGDIFRDCHERVNFFTVRIFSLIIYVIGAIVYIILPGYLVNGGRGAHEKYLRRVEQISHLFSTR